MSKISDLKPEIVWREFDHITMVPRPSKKEEKIRQHLRSFASSYGLPIKEDADGNIVITREASPGRESAPALVLQSHVDMVCEHDSDRIIDFDRDPIDAYVDGDWVRARGTTLGADCGIGMALQMAALIDQSLSTPKLEALFTVDEEQGLTGAKDLAPDMFTATRMINLDSEDEGEIYIGCAGGIDTIATFEYVPQQAPDGYTYYNIGIDGLRGGHSGDDIEKGFACANKLLVRALWLVSQFCPMVIAKIDGGNLRNAIAREASAVIGVPSSVNGVVELVERCFSEMRSEFSDTEPDMRCVIESVETWTLPVLPDHVTMRLIMSLYAVPHGVMAMSRAIHGLVESSTNLASVKMIGSSVVVTTSQRSSVESAKHDVENQVECAFLLAGARVVHSDGYPGWRPNTDSELLRIGESVYSELFGSQPKVKAIHAGLECGLFLVKYPDLDMISIGPTLRGVHSPSERILIDSVEKTWRYLRRIIESI